MKTFVPGGRPQMTSFVPLILKALSPTLNTVKSAAPAGATCARAAQSGDGEADGGEAPGGESSVAATGRGRGTGVLARGEVARTGDPCGGAAGGAERREAGA
jgi:hypothetical protein